jgi:hypothetical protein
MLKVMATAVTAVAFLLAAAGDYTSPASRGDVDRAAWTATIAMTCYGQITCGPRPNVRQRILPTYM